MRVDAVVFSNPREISVREVEIENPDEGDVVVDMIWSGISTGTERLLWSGEMPPFPGMGYPLVPGYEGVGRIAQAPSRSNLEGKLVFVPGTRRFKNIAGLFGATASRLTVEQERAVLLPEHADKEATLLALAATAYHAIVGGMPPDLVIGHGVLGRLIARLTIALGHEAPNVWENNPERDHSNRYAVLSEEIDGRNDYQSIYDVSGDSEILDTLVGRLAPGGEIVLAGFYPNRLSFGFAPFFMKEARVRAAAEWTRADMDAVCALYTDGRLDLSGLVTHALPAQNAVTAYETAFQDPTCLKMILDWSGSA
ncbi:MAG: chlorophyll synthesis pathway protein BchC [Pseudomonadota bacterium]